MTDTIHALEVLWTLLAVGGAAFSVLNVYEAWLDKKHWPFPDGRHAIVAKATLRVEGARLVIQSICVAIGVVTMTLPEPPPDLPVRQGVAKFVIEWGLIVIVTLVTYQSVENRRMRLLLHGERKDR